MNRSCAIKRSRIFIRKDIFSNSDTIIIIDSAFVVNRAQRCEYHKLAVFWWVGGGSVVLCAELMLVAILVKYESARNFERCLVALAVIPRFANGATGGMTGSSSVVMPLPLRQFLWRPQRGLQRRSSSTSLRGVHCVCASSFTRCTSADLFNALRQCQP